MEKKQDQSTPQKFGASAKVTVVEEKHAQSASPHKSRSPRGKSPVDTIRASFKAGDIQKFTIGTVQVDAPKKDYIILQEQLFNLDLMLNQLMQARAKDTQDLKSRIDAKEQEAKMNALKEKQMLDSKIKMELDLEKDALRRLKELKASVAKLDLQTKNLEKQIEALSKKKQADDVRRSKMLESIAMKERQARMKRENAQTMLMNMEVMQKQKLLQKTLKQKQLLQLQSGDFDDSDEVSEPFEEPETKGTQPPIPPPPLPDMRERSYQQYQSQQQQRQYQDAMRMNQDPCQDGGHDQFYYNKTLNATQDSMMPNNSDPCKPYIASFNLLNYLSKGCYSEVALVKSTLTNNKYVVKSICKKDNISKICRMKTIFTSLADNKHPFVATMHDCMQNDSRVFFVMEYLPGGNMKDHLARLATFDECETIFYSACTLLAINHLHCYDIAHRDVKLDNLVLDKCGYVKLVDFDLAIPYVTYNTPLYDKSGTSIYKAPEFFKPCEFTTRAADFWALGVIIHALLTAKCIHTKPALRLAEEKLSPQAEDLLMKMLNLCQNQRLGCGPTGGQDIMKHHFFKDMDWVALYKKQIPPPKRFVCYILNNQCEDDDQKPAVAYCPDDCSNATKRKYN